MIDTYSLPIGKDPKFNPEKTHPDYWKDRSIIKQGKVQ